MQSNQVNISCDHYLPQVFQIQYQCILDLISRDSIPLSTASRNKNCCLHHSALKFPKSIWPAIAGDIMVSFMGLRGKV